jgi:uncharacterized protein YfbU (UPF0304 family)
MEALYPEEEDDFKLKREILENGYRIHYSELEEGFDDEMTEESSREVLDILDMYRALSISVESMKENGNKEYENKKIQFPGFDGNYESNQLVYAKFFMHKMGRFEELQHPGEYPDYNTHSSTLHSYRKMLAYWLPLDDRKYRLSQDETKRLLEMAVYGSLVEIKK